MTGGNPRASTSSRCGNRRPPDTAARHAAPPRAASAPKPRLRDRLSRGLVDGAAGGARGRARVQRLAHACVAGSAAQPQPHRRPRLHPLARPGFCSTTIRPSVAVRRRPSGSALTATSRADARTRRAVSHSSPTTSGTTTSGPSRAAATSSVAASSVACHSPAATSSVAGRTSSRSRHRSHADCRVTPSRVAISAQLFARPRAARTADSSAWSRQPSQRPDVRQRVERRVAVGRAPLVPAPQPLPRLVPVRPGRSAHGRQATLTRHRPPRPRGRRANCPMRSRPPPPRARWRTPRP